MHERANAAIGQRHPRYNDAAISGSHTVARRKHAVTRRKRDVTSCKRAVTRRWCEVARRKRDIDSYHCASDSCRHAAAVRRAANARGAVLVLPRDAVALHSTDASAEPRGLPKGHTERSISDSR